jgi:hypothetical protein
MKKVRFLLPVGILLIVAGFSVVVMLLWNWLMPSIFGLTSIDFWQALGIFILVRILFGGFGHGKWKHHRNHICEKWMEMTPEQQEKFIHRRRKLGFGHPFNRDFRGKKGEDIKEDESTN